MTFEEMLKQQAKVRRKPTDEEHKIQVVCIRWFRLKYPKLKHILFAVPNGGRRDAVTGSKMKDEGATRGVADLILLKSNRFYGGLAIEMKKPGGHQSQAQKEWQRECESAGNKYVICRSFEDFKREIENYIKDM